MAVVQEYKLGNTTVRIHDDYIKSREESIEILERVALGMLRQYNAQMNKEKADKEQLEKDKLQDVKDNPA